MDQEINSVPSGVSESPVSSNKIKTTLRLFKDSWKSFSKKEKYQMIGVFALVLALPAILGGVSIAKYVGSRASSPVTPPVLPTPTSIPKPGCGTTCQSNAGCSTGLICYQPPTQPAKSPCPPGVRCAQVVPVAVCRNPSCPTKSNCVCQTPTPKPVVTPTARPVTPTPKATSFPKATSCSSVSVSGATYGGIVNGKKLYYLSSGGSATLKAITVPAGGSVNWKIATFSSKLSNGGRFSTNYNPTVIYTAPANTSGADQGVDLRGDISEYPSTWLYCPTITMAIHSN